MTREHARWIRLAGLAATIGLIGCSVPRLREKRITIPAGTMISASLRTPLGTGWNHPGDPFAATSLSAVVVDGSTAIPAGAEIRGMLGGVEGAGRVKGRARMTLVFQEIVDPAGQPHRIEAEPLTFAAKSGTRGDLEKLAASGIAGAIVGGIIGGKSGAVKGTAIGAGAGTVWVLVTKGDELELGAGQRLSVRMTEPVEVPVAVRGAPKEGA